METNFHLVEAKINVLIKDLSHVAFFIFKSTVPNFSLLHGFSLLFPSFSKMKQMT